MEQVQNGFQVSFFGGKQTYEGFTVRVDAVEESVSVDVSVASSCVWSSTNGGTGGNFVSRVFKKLLGWSIECYFVHEIDCRRSTVLQ